MGHDWIIDVLADLKTYARANGLSKLAEHLDDGQLVAQIEMASQAKGTTRGASANDTAVGTAPRAVGGC